jgi:hypothetical protein
MRRHRAWNADPQVGTHPRIGATGDIEVAAHGKISKSTWDPELAGAAVQSWVDNFGLEQKCLAFTAARRNPGKEKTKSSGGARR